MDILFIKTSSLGDVIHHMPALTDARRAYPDARFTWLVEAPYAPLVRLHPAVDAVIPVASRRWRASGNLLRSWHEMRAFMRDLRAQDYHAVVDTQGLIRTGLIARLARGRRHGYNWNSIKEPLASLFYDEGHRVDHGWHAVARNRALAARSLGYSVQGPADYGLTRPPPANGAERYGLFLHSTARPEKEWPEANWVALGERLAGARTRLVLPWGTAAERARAERLARAVPGADVPDAMPLDAMAALVAGASFVVGVDTGLLHLAAAYGVPLTAVFRASEPGLTGPVGTGPIAVLGGPGAAPSVDEVAAAVSAGLR